MNLAHELRQLTKSMSYDLPFPLFQEGCMARAFKPDPLHNWDVAKQRHLADIGANIPSAVSYKRRDGYRMCAVDNRVDAELSMIPAA
jgi:hypothetical protein